MTQPRFVAQLLDLSGLVSRHFWPKLFRFPPTDHFHCTCYIESAVDSRRDLADHRPFVV